MPPFILFRCAIFHAAADAADDGDFADDAAMILRVAAASLLLMLIAAAIVYACADAALTLCAMPLSLPLRLLRHITLAR